MCSASECSTRNGGHNLLYSFTVNMHSLCHSLFLFLLSYFLITAVSFLEGSYFFNQQPENPRDCEEVYAQCSSNNSSGVYTIKPDGYPKPFEVYCDIQILTGGWTVIHRQIDGSLTLKRTWEDYRNGFGFLSTEFYIGNDKLSYLTNQAVYELRVDMMLSNGSHFIIRYNNFRISDEWSQYALASAEEFSGNASCVATSCPMEMVHGNCECQTFCRDPVGKTNCYEICEEFCLPKGCFVNEANAFIVEGESYSDPACTKRCSCTNRQLTCDNNYQCDENAMCENRSDSHQCYCNEGYSGNGVTCRSICQENEVYGTCTCQKSCANPADCISCNSVKGCHCPNGFFLQGGDCVRQEHCSCFIDGLILPEGSSYSDPVCTKRCSCTKGQLSCNNNYQCDVDAACERRSEYHECHCNPGYSGDGVTCLPICSTNEVYGTCSCQKSCDNPAGCVSCPGGQRCYCPDGFYLQGGNCVPQDRCSCYIDGHILPDGDTYVNSDCTRRCTCNNNHLSCDRSYQCTSNAACRVLSGERQCYCNSGFEGDGTSSCTRPYTDCNDVQNAGHTSGVYTIRPTGWSGSPFNVFCNMTIDDGGWTVFQRRKNGTTNFYRNWAAYKNGFGDIQNEFWLGNEKLYYLTQQATYEVRVDYVSSSHSSYYNKYTSFRIDNEASKYRVTDLGLYRITGKNSLNNIRNIAFSTYDQDNDRKNGTDCAEGHRSGWWHGGCYFSFSYSYCSYFPEGSRHRVCSAGNLNGDYNGSNGTNIFAYDCRFYYYYYYFYNYHCNIIYTEIKLRRTS